jgi:hypothetical protein
VPGRRRLGRSLDLPRTRNKEARGWDVPARTEPSQDYVIPSRKVLDNRLAERIRDDFSLPAKVQSPAANKEEDTDVNVVGDGIEIVAGATRVNSGMFHRVQVSG